VDEMDPKEAGHILNAMEAEARGGVIVDMSEEALPEAGTDTRPFVHFSSQRQAVFLGTLGGVTNSVPKAAHVHLSVQRYTVFVVYGGWRDLSTRKNGSG
jgi:hypothetical protein